MAAGKGDVLSRRALNRATLARQFLLEPSDVSPLDAIRHLIGLQAQASNPPYYALWCRLRGFEASELSELISDRSVVRLGLMRSTIFLSTTDDALWVRPLVQPAVDRGFASNHAKGLNGADADEVGQRGRALVDAEPRTFAQLATELSPTWPDADPESLAQTVRTKVPLVQVPPRGLWGRAGASASTSLEHWSGRVLESAPSIDGLALRYLAAFGPASVKDMQTWSGLTRLGEVFDRLDDQLRTFTTDGGVQLFDLDHAPRPDEATEAPVRLFAPFDNIVLSHADRSRFIDEQHKLKIMTQNGIVYGGMLVDGEVVGSWHLRTAKPTTFLELIPFKKVSKTNARALEAEGQRLLAFACGPNASSDVRFTAQT